MRGSHFLQLFSFIVLVLPIRTLGDDPCKEAFCGQGTCAPSALGTNYTCTCKLGWKQAFDARACILPICSIDFECGNNAPPPQPLPPPPPGFTLPPFLDPLSGCFLIWCNEGTCLSNGTKHTCECNSGSSNLLNLPDYPCFKKCSIGLDCNSPPASPPPPNGSDKILKRWSNIVVSLSTIILAWIMHE
ncbi:uncharacterized protein LOC121803274 isoform X2 [Salvia splendens]|uniref:uncharacterized protein LOC121803274 isoform X2 n=1 Tax=Salvia splendens TaxID=180675 RepID=UPI001C27EAEC|nr:uncharacterized protein LOC121803274 isoform X2 [Salvia splendens]